MIGQPLGCILVLLIGVISVSLAIALLWCASFFRPGLFACNATSLWASVGIGFFLFFPLLELGHRLEIRLFFRRHGLRIVRIRGFKNHYRVDYLDGTTKMSGRWPKDFESWVRRSVQSQSK
jgi:hypothetical protein